MKYVIYHNPRCSKSRQTLDILRDHGIQPTVVEYLNTPPAATELRRIVSLLGLRPKDLVRTKEDDFKNTAIDPENDSDVIALLAGNPRLLERPIVVAGDRAVIGRPPENVLGIIPTVQ